MSASPRWRVAAAALVLAVAGCAAPTDDEPVAGGTASREEPAGEQREGAEAPDAPEGPGAGPEAPLGDGLDFVLPALGGGQVVGAELAGRDVALWFWAPW